MRTSKGVCKMDWNPGCVCVRAHTHTFFFFFCQILCSSSVALWILNCNINNNNDNNNDRNKQAFWIKHRNFYMQCLLLPFTTELTEWSCVSQFRCFWKTFRAKLTKLSAGRQYLIFPTLVRQHHSWIWKRSTLFH